MVNRDHYLFLWIPMDFKKFAVRFSSALPSAVHYLHDYIDYINYIDYIDYPVDYFLRCWLEWADGEKENKHI